jgi:hypothetical protein
MTVLGMNSSLVLNSFGIDDKRIVGAAFTVRILLPLLERCVCGLRPAERIIPLGRGGRTDLPNFSQVVIKIFLLVKACQTRGDRYRRSWELMAFPAAASAVII